MVDGHGRKGKDQLAGMTDTMKRAMFYSNDEKYKKGDFVLVEVTDAT